MSLGEDPINRTAHVPRPPMDDAEHRIVVRSQVGRCVFATVCGAVGVALSAKGIVSLGVAITAVLGWVCGFGIAGKFFPDSGAVLTRRFRNYRRAKRGLPPVDEADVPAVIYHDDFRRG